MPYPTRAELIEASTVDELVGLTAAQQDGLRAAAIANIESATGQVFTSINETRIVDGNGRRKLYLPARLEAIDTLEVFGSSLDATDVFVQNDDGSSFLEVSRDAIGGNWLTRALRDDDPPMFAAGIGTVEITGTWGWTSCPDAVVEAIRTDMEDAALAQANPLAQTSRALRKAGLDSIQQGPLIARAGKPWAISPAVIALIERFAWQTAAAVA